MCRLAAFPPRYSRERAIKVIESLNKGNPDGFGYAYVNNDKFIINKWPFSFAFINSYTKINKKLLSHMPYDGWTIAHLRWASHGANKKENTHPFVFGNYATIHNGVWLDYYLIKEALKGFVKFNGQTDSEVAAYLINKIGPQKFSQNIQNGVFLSLERNGNLHIMKGDGDLQYYSLKNNELFASSLNRNKASDVANGYYVLSNTGELLFSKVKKEKVKINYANIFDPIGI